MSRSFRDVNVRGEETEFCSGINDAYRQCSKPRKFEIQAIAGSTAGYSKFHMRVGGDRSVSPVVFRQALIYARLTTMTKKSQEGE